MDRGFTAYGFNRKKYEDILDELQIRSKQEFGDNININDNSPLAKFLKVIAWHSAEMWEVYEYGYYQNYLLTAEGYGLDAWASNFGESRRLGTKAQGVITIKGTPGLRVPKGFRVSGGDLVYETTQAKSLGENGQADFPIAAIQVGAEYNLLPNTIKTIVNPIIGVASVINKDAITQGIGVENDAELRERLLFKIRTPMTGDNKNQYEYWAKENEKVGAVQVIRAKPQPGYVTVKIAARAGGKADEELIKEVYDYIKPLQPTTSGLVVESLDNKDIVVKIEGIRLNNNASIESIKRQLNNDINRYFSTDAAKTREISVAKISYMIISNQDISDFTKLSINSSSENLLLDEGYIPVLSDIVLEVL